MGDLQIIGAATYTVLDELLSREHLGRWIDNGCERRADRPTGRLAVASHATTIR